MSAEQKKYPRVLIVSHTVLARNTSMGKTMDTYFSGWDRDAIAQLYIQSEIPTDPLCVNYFRFTDPDALKSIVQRRRKGTVFTEADVRPDRADPVEMGNLTGVYNYGRKRTPLIFLARDGMWRLSGWKHSGMLEWAKSFRPDVIFYASGDYGFSYRITRFLSEKLGIPYVICCFDDFYLFNPNRDMFLGKFRHNRFMKTARETLDRAAKILTVNDTMAEVYGRTFGRKCGVVWTAAGPVSGPETDIAEKRGIAYLGDAFSDPSGSIRSCYNEMYNANSEGAGRQVNAAGLTLCIVLIITGVLILSFYLYFKVRSVRLKNKRNAEKAKKNDSKKRRRR